MYNVLDVRKFNDCVKVNFYFCKLSLSYRIPKCQFHQCQIVQIKKARNGFTVAVFSIEALTSAAILSSSSFTPALDFPRIVAKHSPAE